MIAHFGLGIFWKASVHPWRGGEPLIDLGRYGDMIRKRLKGESEFPEHVHLVVVIERPHVAQITVSYPYEGIRDAWRTHYFHVPGILYMLAV